MAIPFFAAYTVSKFSNTLSFLSSIEFLSVKAAAMLFKACAMFTSVLFSPEKKGKNSFGVLILHLLKLPPITHLVLILE